MKSSLISLILGLYVFILPANAADPSLVAYFPMELNGNLITETISGQTFSVQNNLNPPESKPGAVGNALRLDGYSTYCSAAINASALSTTALTASIWCAIETYPVMDPNNNVTTETFIAGNMSDVQKTGFAFVINATGRYGFAAYINGTKITCYDPSIFPTYGWVNISAVINTQTQMVYLYRNGVLIAESSFPGTIINVGSNAFIIGKSFTDMSSGIFLTSTINGLIDEIKIYSRILTSAELAYIAPQNAADLSIPSTRFANDIQRPSFHGLPAANWTNEPHGLVYYNGLYHLFFQKNANGPYWGKLHWGHLTSNDLLNWTEQKIAISNTNIYDIKGAWSGCVFTDPVLTGGKPNIFYTGVDYSKASINQAEPVADDLINWNKDARNPIIPNSPIGLSSDFRDPHIFTSNGIYYMIVGTSKNNVGATTLQQYNPTTQTWSNDGRIFYQAASSDYGTFWEMPVIEPMPNGKWLFLVSTIGGVQGVTTLYWVGTINSDGTFNPSSSVPKKVELGAFGSNGYGLLSPSILHQNGKTIAIGIVPDLLSSQNNYNLGWAHLFSLPREWTIDANNNLIQQPYSGTQNMRVISSAYTISNQDISGSLSLSPVSGKTVEIDGNFIVSSAQSFGFHVRKNGNNFISIYYSPSTNNFTVDATNIARLSNDAGSFNGLYQSVLPQAPSIGDTIRIHIFIDHSIMDVFISNQYAFSIRVFPTDPNANDIEAFSTGGSTHAASIQAWNLDSSQTATAITPPTIDNNVKLYTNGNNLIYKNIPSNSNISIYNLWGQKIISLTSAPVTGRIQLIKNRVYIVKVTGQNLSFADKILL